MSRQLNRDEQGPAPGCYRLAAGVSLSKDGRALCAYPLRALRPGPFALQLLHLCREYEQSTEELARLTEQPLKRVIALCAQLTEKGLLEAGPDPAPAQWPGVSIVIPSRNRSAQLARCLRALQELDYPATSLEIIVVDDASSDETGSLLQGLVGEFAASGIELRTVRHAQQRGVAHARNSGAEAARHELLAYLDSDCVANPNWLAELAPAFQNPRLAAAGGRIRAYERQSLLGRYEDVRSSLFMGTQPQAVRLSGPLTYLPTANLLLRRSAWQALGGFAPLTYGEDVDLCRRLLASKQEIRYLPRSLVYHDYRTNLRAFLAIRMAYAGSEATLLQLHPGERRVLVLPPEQALFSVATGGGLISLGLSRGSLWRRMGGLLGLGLAALILGVGTLRRWRKAQRQSLPFGPLLILQASLRAQLAYSYHLSRHLTRYYTLPLLAASLLFPPLLVLLLLLYGIMVSVDYIRLRPRMSPLAYGLCALLDDCAYGAGIIQGCWRQRTWQPLFPIIKRGNTT